MIGLGKMPKAMSIYDHKERKRRSPQKQKHLTQRVGVYKNAYYDNQLIKLFLFKSCFFCLYFVFHENCNQLEDILWLAIADLLYWERNWVRWHNNQKSDIKQYWTIRRLNESAPMLCSNHSTSRTSIYFNKIMESLTKTEKII